MSGRVWIVGSGRVGASLAAALRGSRMFAEVCLIGRSADPPSPPGLAYHSVRSGRIPAPLPPAADGVQLLVFCVPDDSLTLVASSWAEALTVNGVAVDVALHTSGFHPGEALATLRKTGASVGSWHPLVALAQARSDAFRDASIGVEGDEPAVNLGSSIARVLGGRPIRVRPEHKALYHVAAVFGSNYLVACLAVATRELAAACEGQVGLEDLLPLARSAVENLAQSGLAEGLTGPIVRGDEGTVAGHLEALDPGTAFLYRALAAELLNTAADRSDRGAVRRIARLLEIDAGARDAPGEGSG